MALHRRESALAGWDKWSTKSVREAVMTLAVNPKACMYFPVAQWQLGSSQAQRVRNYHLPLYRKILVY